MDVPNITFCQNRDWDPSYLQQLLSQDFYDYDELWSSNIGNMELVKEVEKVERYSPIVEDISLEDDILCSAVEKIEEE